MERSAAIAGNYRYWLRRRWRDRGPEICWVMLNPSRADGRVDDPTVRRCLGFSQAWGYASLVVVNLFAYRTPYPADLQRVADPIGPATDRHLHACARGADRLLLAWGNRGKLLGRDRAVLADLEAISPLYCLGRTQQGQPRHPLYLPRAARPERWQA